MADRIDLAGCGSILRDSFEESLHRKTIEKRTDRSMGRVERQREIARRRKRRVQLTKMRVRYAAATSETEKAEILAKARRMSPFVELETPASS